LRGKAHERGRSKGEISRREPVDIESASEEPLGSPQVNKGERPMGKGGVNENTLAIPIEIGEREN